MDTHCGDDLLLRQEAESLLGYPVSRDGFMEEPAFELAAKQMARELATRGEADVLSGRTVGNFRVLASGIGHTEWPAPVLGIAELWRKCACLANTLRLISESRLYADSRSAEFERLAGFPKISQETLGGDGGHNPVTGQLFHE